MSETERNLLQQIGPTSRALFAAFEAQVGHAMPRWRIMQALQDMKDATQKELVHRLLMDPGALTRHMKQMEAEGLIHRHADPQDNRLTRVALTAAGTALITAAQPQRHAFFAKALAGLDPERVAIAQSVLKEVEERLRAMTQERVQD
ncbi:MarR family winged helix-turn-helix transcriptional regulator [Silvimonas iriomotensis]|uniref:MarR family transcriptional regulator n=1 Tax=Silvimonas iriomotensis TaxID=449662 RepID=A0ABQ2P8C9_9NEIS|nr:MarR family winged helix-turn-helix transcriptional regulator [Silvimonas iriomotensis]GGP20578.1 MarR family transcriptional regulator [Silvimonas iriomotensis]